MSIFDVVTTYTYRGEKYTRTTVHEAGSADDAKALARASFIRAQMPECMITRITVKMYR
jgi:hypothetical protein